MQVSGKLKLTDDRLVWKNKNRKEEFSAKDFELVNWQRLAGSWGIRIFTKEGSLHRFAGFKEAVSENQHGFLNRSKMATNFFFNSGARASGQVLQVLVPA